MLLAALYATGVATSVYLAERKLDREMESGHAPNIWHCVWLSFMTTVWPLWIAGKVLAAPVQLCLPDLLQGASK